MSGPAASGAPTAHADVVVVGGGAAGCVVAARLAAATSATIRLLEAGPALSGQAPTEFHDGWRLPQGFDWGYTAEADDRGVVEKVRRIKLLGGSSWLTRFAVRGSPADFDDWAARGNPGWAFDEVLPWFRRLEADAEFGAEAWHGDRGPIPITRYPGEAPTEIHAAALRAFEAIGVPAVDDHNRPGAVGVGRMPMSSREGIRVTTVDAYLSAEGRPSNLTVQGDAQAANVLFEGARVAGVRLVDGTTISTGRVVLCAGTYGSPMILMRSGIGPAGHLRSLGVPVTVDLPGVGANLADHPGVDLDSGWQGDGVDGPVLHSIATLRSSLASPTDPPDLMLWVSDPQAAAPGFWLDPVLLRPRSRGSVRLRSADPLAPPIVELPGLREAADVDRLAEAYRLGLEIAHRPEIRQHCHEPGPAVPGGAAELRQAVRQNAYSIPHTVGTCAMGPSPEDGAVVDAAGAVHGTTGLSVVDASVIPGAPSGFPHIVTIMIAERLSEAIARLL